MLIPTSFDHLSSHGYTVMPTIIATVIASLLPLPCRAPRRDKSLIQELHTDFCARSSRNVFWSGHHLALQLLTYWLLRKTPIGCGVSKRKKGSQATDAKIAWLTLTEGIPMGIGCLGECLQAYSPVFSASSCKKCQDFSRVCDGSPF
jgi:hypothetical protein